MSGSQILLLALIVFVLFLFIRKFLLTRNIKQYSASEVKEKIRNNKNIILLDVRTKAERSAESIKGSFQIPLNELKNRNSELNKNKEIICYCRSGSRSLSAASQLMKQGFNASNLKGGIISWNSKN